MGGRENNPLRVKLEYICGTRKFAEYSKPDVEVPAASGGAFSRYLLKCAGTFIDTFGCSSICIVLARMPDGGGMRRDQVAYPVSDSSELK